MHIKQTYYGKPAVFNVYIFKTSQNACFKISVKVNKFKKIFFGNYTVF